MLLQRKYFRRNLIYLRNWRQKLVAEKELIGKEEVKTSRKNIGYLLETRRRRYVATNIIN